MIWVILERAQSLAITLRLPGAAEWLAKSVYRKLTLPRLDSDYRLASDQLETRSKPFLCVLG
jgi:uncharacterized protein YozE (UPF0346 family)